MKAFNTHTDKPEHFLGPMQISKCNHRSNTREGKRKEEANAIKLGVARVNTPPGIR